MNQRSLIGIVAGQYNPDYVQGLVNAATLELRAIMPHAAIQLIQVPGAFEIPFATKLLIEEKHPAAVLALGVVVAGETDHARIVNETVARSLQDLSLSTRVPVIHCVLSVQNLEQAAARCLDEENNRGTEAARTAVEMIRLMEEFTKNERT